MAQTAVCNRHHWVDQQLYHWLLLPLDRLSSKQLTMTQELIVNVLGVRREVAPKPPVKLRRLGVISYTRGQIMVLDRPRFGTACVASVMWWSRRNAIAALAAPRPSPSPVRTAKPCNSVTTLPRNRRTLRFPRNREQMSPRTALPLYPVKHFGLHRAYTPRPKPRCR